MYILFSRKFKRILFSILLSFILIISAVVPCFAWDNGQTVKVAFFPLGNFQYYGSDGSPAGYNTDYLNKIAESTHWHYEYISCDSWVDAMALVESGDADMVAPAQITTERLQTYDFSSYQMGIESAAILTLSGNDQFIYEDFDKFSDITFGCAEHSPITQNFTDNYCPESGFTPNIKYYSDMSSLLQGLDTGEIDAAVTNIMFSNEKYKMLGQFSVSPVYYMLAKGQDELLSQLNNALVNILVDSPSFQSDLISEYFPIYNNTQLTYSEREYLKTLPELSVGYVINQMPVSYQDDNGEFAGITRDILDLISKYSGVKFNYVPLPVTNVSEDYLKNNHIYMVSSVEYNPQNESMSKMYMTKPYLQSDRVFVSKSGLEFDTQSSLTIAVATGSATLPSVINDTYPNFRVEIYDSIDDCFAAVRRGKADLLMQNRYTVENFMGKPQYDNMQVIPLQNITDDMCLAALDLDDSELCTTVNNPMLVDILDKAVNQISTYDVNSIIITNTSETTYHYTLLDTFYKYWYILFLMTLVILLLTMLVIHKQRTSAALQLTNKNLTNAVAAAEKANGAKSQFLAQMSHEIRTPMNAIIGLTTIARSEVNNPEKMSDYLGKIDGSSRLLLGIINDVLDMSAIETKKLKLASEPFDFKSLVSSLTTVFYQQAKQKGITFEVRMNGVTDEWLVGDQLRVNQILMNLLSNAVKFTPAGGEIDMMIIQTSKQTDKIHMRFSVSDTGCGMSEDMQNRLFMPFEQESATTARKHGGSGLGLSIAKNLTEMMGGNIQVTSKIDVGSVFTVDLPFGVDPEANHVDTAKFEAVRVLIVDDDKDSCEYTAMLLERLGVRHDYVTAGEAALEALGEAEDKNDPYKLCIVDWKMPDMNGIEVTQQIRQIFGDEAIIIIVSAYDLNEVEGEARMAGADMFMSKPLFQSTLFDILIKITGGDYTKVDGQEFTSDKYDFTGKHVLIAEDVTLNMEVAVKLLKMVGIDADCAEDGQQAVHMYKQHDAGYYDIILLDINMPVMDGYEAARAIRSSGQADAGSVPLYAMTANAFTEDIAAALDAGMNGHIAKPIETSVLYNTLSKAFEGGLS